MTKHGTIPPQMVIRRAGFAIALAATFVASAAFAQTTPQWRIDAAKADAAYQQAMEQAAEKRRLAALDAGENWRIAIEAEMASAAKRGDAATADALQASIEEARTAGRVALERPAGVVTLGKHGYALIDQRMTWTEAKKHCEKLGGHLLILDDPAEENLILSKWSEVDFWTGATDRWTPGRHMTLDGKPARSFVAPFVPDDRSGFHHCIGWWVTGKNWNDHADGSRLPFICEWE